MTANGQIEKGQVYASTHAGDVENGWRQHRTVVDVNTSFVWLQTEIVPGQKAAPTRIRLRQTLTGPRIPGHKLVRR